MKKEQLEEYVEKQIVESEVRRRVREIICRVVLYAGTIVTIFYQTGQYLYKNWEALKKAADVFLKLIFEANKQ